MEHDMSTVDDKYWEEVTSYSCTLLTVHISVEILSPSMPYVHR